MGFFGVLGLIFIVLKLLGVITWSWWLVTIPLWGGAALIVAFGLLIGLVASVATGVHKALK